MIKLVAMNHRQKRLPFSLHFKENIILVFESVDYE